MAARRESEERGEESPNDGGVDENEVIEQIFHRYLRLVEAEIARSLQSREDTLLFRIIRYHLGLDQPGSRGKRVRPVLCLLACEAVGGEAEAAAPAAAAVELVHAFTLLHDDIADQDELRRGRPAAWREWGVGQALTAGDGLYALANLCLVRLDTARLGPDRALAACRCVNEAVLELCQGQQMDLSFEGRADVSVEDYLAMVVLKTGALLGAAAQVGALLGGATSEAASALGRFGRALGAAFQVRDDILGLWGDPALTGKPVGGDLLRRKRSLPVIYALSAAGPGSELSRRLLAGPAGPEEAAELATVMDQLGARSHAEQKAAELLAQARAELESLSLVRQREEELWQLACYLVSRTA